MKTLAPTLAALAAITTMASAEPKQWTLDLGHAYVGWEIDHMGLSRTVGQFRSYDGTFLIDEEEPANSQITFTVDLASVDSNHIGRDNHIRNADYLDVENHPTATFTSTEVEMLTPSSGKVHGDLDLRGVIAPITLDFRMVRNARYPEFIPNYDEVRVVGFEATGEILRLDHGMDFIAFLGSPTGLSIDLDLHFDLVDCEGAAETNVPCNWGRVAGFKGPNE
ncbi:YceI family protein [Marivita hallyeonensis]|uniref:Polyisoprenoid-binding protein YceI n=1 Tax=Marivita hallyeonensis TaxID=996342 RepID=A0A1M5SCJ5_9RHOB|nr:YceI family protein [Marivita hallyeonensis]SHH36254.1 Polyisoprenoid-binding protein YceI [Marivita hallyeonensis]